MAITYKFWYIKKDDDVHVNEVAVRVYEGIKQQKILKDKPETVFSLNKRLSDADYKKTKRKTKTDNDGGHCLVFTDADFGNKKDISSVVEWLDINLPVLLKKEIVEKGIIINTIPNI